MRRLSEAQAKFAGNLLKEAKESANVKLTNLAIAAKAKFNERVVRDVIHGRCRTPLTVRKICAAAGIDLDAMLSQAGLTDDDDASNRFGGYAKANYRHLIGNFTTFRFAYSTPDTIKCYKTIIDWDAGHSALRFSEANRDEEYRQSGHIFIPSPSNCMYLVTINNGWVRTVLVSAPVPNQSAYVMRGLILSQFNADGPNRSPICSPIVYEKQHPDQPEIMFGDVGKNDPRYERYRRLLDETISRGYIRFAIPNISFGPAKSEQQPGANGVAPPLSENITSSQAKADAGSSQPLAELSEPSQI